MRKVLASRLFILTMLFVVCCVSAYGDPVFSVGADAVRDVVVDGTKAIVQAGPLPGVMPIPEPATMLLLGSGLVGLLGNKVRRRFRK